MNGSIVISKSTVSDIFFNSKYVEHCKSNLTAEEAAKEFLEQYPEIGQQVTVEELVEDFFARV